MEEMTSVSD